MLDETTANTVGALQSRRLKANAIGFYPPIRGEAVIHFGKDSKDETFIEFLKREENPYYKVVVLIMEEHKAHYLPYFR